MEAHQLPYGCLNNVHDSGVGEILHVVGSEYNRMGQGRRNQERKNSNKRAEFLSLTQGRQ